MLELEDKSKTMLCVIKFINMLMYVLFVKLFSVVVCSDVYLKIGVGLFLLFYEMIMMDMEMCSHG